MCGIVGYVGNGEAEKYLLNGLKRLEYRGYDSAGIAVFENQDINIVKTKGRLSVLENKINEFSHFKGRCGIGHTRWATHGEPSSLNAHPLLSGNVVLVHNGIIENYQQLKQKFASKGVTFESETDTEVIVKIMDYYYRGDPISAIDKTIENLEGSYALGIMFKDKKDTVYAVKKDSPLVIGVGKGESFIASDIPAFIEKTNKYIILEHNEIAKLNKDEVQVLDLDGEVINKTIHTADWDVEAAEKNGYPHFMLKEINEQPEAFKRCIGSRIKNSKLHFTFKTLNDNFLKRVERIVIIGCGTAMHAGILGKHLIEKLARIPAVVDLASEFRYRNPILTKNDLAVFISQSGETADTLAALRLAKQKKVASLAVVNTVGSSIAREADDVFYTYAGPEIAVASTKAYTVQLASMYLLAIKLGVLRGIIPPKEQIRYAKILEEIPSLIQKTLTREKEVLKAAGVFQNAKNLFFIGRGIDYCLSLEGSLKLKEISYIHSEAYAAGELKHGTISLIEKHTPVVAIATQGDVLLKTVNNVKEVKTRGADVLLILKENFKIDRDISDIVIEIPDIDDLFSPLLTIVPLQLFAYHTAVLKGCDVDNPRNLAKSVTVE